MTVTRKWGRRRGRAARRAERVAAPLVQKRYVTREIPIYELLDPAGVELIHDTSMRILEEIGIEFRDDVALAQWRRAGADVRDRRVRIPRDLIAEKLALIPASYTQHARNPRRNVVIGGDSTVFAPTFGSPFVRDLDNVRRYATLEDLRNFIKLTYMTPVLHHDGGIICEPVDIPVPRRHLDIVYSHIRYSDKPFMGVQSTPERAFDSCKMVEILFGKDFVRDHPVLTSVVNSNSPLVWDGSMLGSLRHYAEHNQPALVTPFIMAGAMAPAATAGAIAQLNAEVTAGLAYSQLVKPGVPMVYGSFLATVSMRSGAPMMGTPETVQMIYVVGQLARRYGVPMRSGGMLNGAKVADAQAAFESMQTMTATLLAGTHFVLHAAGWLEAGLTAGYAKFVMDAEQVAMLDSLSRKLDLSENGLALEAVREVGPGNHYLGCAHTRRNYLDGFFIPELADNNSFEQWRAEGARTHDERAAGMARRQLERYEPPPLDEGLDEALRDFMDRRRAELPDSAN